jgi:DNA-directed RNA polymerase subunit RPC12/RpoP
VPSVLCPCGKTSRFSDAQRGRTAKCPQCSQNLVLKEADNTDEVALALLHDEEAQPQSKPYVRDAGPPPKTPAFESRPLPVQQPTVHKPQPLPKPVKKKKRSSDEDEGGGFNLPRVSLSPAVLSGLGLILLGGIWLGVGLAANRVYPYSVVIMLIGLFRAISALFGNED